MSDNTKVTIGMIGGLIGTACLLCEIILVVLHWREIWVWWMEAWLWPQWLICAMVLGSSGWSWYDKYRHLIDGIVDVKELAP